MSISEQGDDLFSQLFMISMENDRKWLDFYHFLNTLKNILLPDINGQIIEQDREETKIRNEAKFAVGVQALWF